MSPTVPALQHVPRLSAAADLELAARRIVEGLYSGRHRSPYAGSAVEFSDYRAYQPGDDLRSVDWRAYARSDHLLVRRYHEERDLPLVLLLDTSASMDYGTPAKRDWAIQAAAALALLAVDQGDRVRLAAGATSLAVWTPSLAGPSGLTRCWAELSRLTWSSAGDLPVLLDAAGRQLERRTLIVILGDFLLDPARLDVPLAALSGRGHELALIQVLDRSEIALPEDWGLSAMADPEGVVAPLTCDAGAAKSDYDARLREHISQCRARATACRGDHVLAATDQPVADVLGGWLARRKRR